jgi:hypothetical protein
MSLDDGKKKGESGWKDCWLDVLLTGVDDSTGGSVAACAR